MNAAIPTLGSMSFLGNHKQVNQTGWLKTTEFFVCHSSRGQKFKTRVSQGRTPSSGCRAGSSLPRAASVTLEVPRLWPHGSDLCLTSTWPPPLRGPDPNFLYLFPLWRRAIVLRVHLGETRISSLPESFNLISSLAT